MEIRERESEGVAIVELAGRLVAGEDAAALRDSLQRLAAAGRRQVLLNFAAVDYIDSSGLGTLVYCFTTFQRAGGSLKLAALNERNLELMVLTKLATVFELYHTEREALDSFFPGRAAQPFDILEFVRRQKGGTAP